MLDGVVRREKTMRGSRRSGDEEAGALAVPGKAREILLRPATQKRLGLGRAHEGVDAPSKSRAER